jgi:histidinol phosphatase-like PHP family hydrolase
LVDILFYFYDIKELKKFYEKEILPKKQRLFHTTRTTLTLNELIELSEKHRCIISVAHPFGYQLRSNIRGVFEKYETVLEKCDIFEAMNGGNGRKPNLKAINYIRKNNKGFTAGTDGHSIYSLGNIVTCSKAKNVEEFLDNIKSKKNIIIGEEAKLGKLGEYGRFALNKIKNIFEK